MFPSNSTRLASVRSTNSLNADPLTIRNDISENYVDPVGIPRYLTTIISSSLKWLDDHEQEQVWEAASKRLSERSGRSAAPSMTRTFRISDELSFQLNEPSLTEDSLGLKTWTSSLLLSRRLKDLAHHIPHDDTRVLELGSGTGLVGLATAFLWQDFVTEVLLTDLPGIMPNLQENIKQNMLSNWTTDKKMPRVHSRILDWSNQSDVPSSDTEKYNIVVAADPIYSADHPRLLADTVRRWLTQSPQSRFIVELPLRQGYAKERCDLKQRLEEFLAIIEEGEEIGFDDWETADGRPAEVECWWSVWQTKPKD
ncbi:Protein-lysine N-methyltransferase rrg1 [Neophaeococcomyces mojaviensis]|uniref:Protein-lysine N-methyltransferase rrg1 n=1 Tax=Neophaeococcomyces mojaviensis TaxID=3383035 RepID=A0ACC3ACJ2_9EURO|nr:Protein-lysine N-methyltransferase rrg1 [Knufia sp. JES_112]